MNDSPVIVLLILLLSNTSAASEVQKVEATVEASCPDPRDIDPCVCSNNGGNLTMDCSDVQDENELWHIFGAYFPTTAFYELNIGHNEGLKVLENGVFHDVSFQVIDIGNSAMQNVESESLRSSLSTLTDIFITYCQLATFPFERLLEFTSLTELSLYGNNIPSIPPLSSSTLKHLDLGYNPFSSLPPDVFKGLPAIQTIYLNDCQLTEIPPGGYRGEVGEGTVHTPGGSLPLCSPPWP